MVIHDTFKKTSGPVRSSWRMTKGGKRPLKIDADHMRWSPASPPIAIDHAIELIMERRTRMVIHFSKDGVTILVKDAERKVTRR